MDCSLIDAHTINNTLLHVQCNQARQQYFRHFLVYSAKEIYMTYTQYVIAGMFQPQEISALPGETMVPHDQWQTFQLSLPWSLSSAPVHSLISSPMYINWLSP